MTVIFNTTSASLPVLAGDMLLSRLGPPGKTDLRLPSHPNGVVVPTVEAPRYIPVVMRRKVFVLNDHLAVGAAGSVAHIRTFLNDLAAALEGSSGLSYADVGRFLDEYGRTSGGSEAMGQIAALLLVQAEDWHGSLIAGRSEHKKADSSLYGRVVAIGTGADSIVREAQKLDQNYRHGMTQPADGDTAFPEFQTLAANLMLLANVYWGEFNEPRRVFDAWGGAYDLIYQDSSKVFQHLDGYTIFLRLFDVEQEEAGIQLVNVLKYERRKEVSFIAMLVDGQLDFFAAKDLTASDEPLSFRVGGSGFSMNSRIHISIIAVGKGQRFLAPIIQIDGLDPGEDAKQTVFTWFDESGRLNIAFNANHEEWLKSQAMQLYKENADRFA